MAGVHPTTPGSVAQFEPRSASTTSPRFTFVGGPENVAFIHLRIVPTVLSEDPHREGIGGPRIIGPGTDTVVDVGLEGDVLGLCSDRRAEQVPLEEKMLVAPFSANDFSQPSPFRQQLHGWLWVRPDPITHQHAKVAAIKMVSWLQPRSQGREKIFARAP